MHFVDCIVYLYPRVYPRVTVCTKVWRIVYFCSVFLFVCCCFFFFCFLGGLICTVSRTVDYTCYINWTQVLVDLNCSCRSTFNATCSRPLICGLKVHFTLSIYLQCVPCMELQHSMTSLTSFTNKRRRLFYKILV